MNTTKDLVNALQQDLVMLRTSHKNLADSVLRMKQGMLKQERKVEIDFQEMRGHLDSGDGKRGHGGKPSRGRHGAHEMKGTKSKKDSPRQIGGDKGEGVSQFMESTTTPRDAAHRTELGLSTIDNPELDGLLQDRVIGETGTSLPKDDARLQIVQHPSLRVLIPKDLHAKYSDGHAKKDLTNMATECDCQLTFSSEYFPKTNCYILQAEKMSVKGDPVHLISMAVNLMYGTAKVEVEILIPEFICAELEKYGKKKYHEVIAKSKADVHWSIPKAEFAEPAVTINDEPEKERALKGVGISQQINALIREIYAAQLRRVDPTGGASDLPTGTIDEQVNDLKEREKSQRRTQYTLDKKDVEAKMKTYGLTEDATKDLDQDAIRQALEILRETQLWRYYLLKMIRSKPIQVSSFICICMNMMVMWVEVDLEASHTFAENAGHIQYFFTVLFLIEASINLIALPQVWRYKEVFVDAMVCYLAFFLETLARVPGPFQGSSGGNFLLLLRMVRFYRFFRMIKGYQGARTVRVIIAGFSGAMLNLVWILTFLFIIFYCGGILFRSLLKAAEPSPEAIEACAAMSSALSCVNSVSKIDCVWRKGECLDELTYIKTEYFASVQTTMLSLLDTYMEGFDHTSVIARPLMGASGLFQAVGFMWTFYNLMMKIIVANIIAGLFIEQLKKDAGRADEKQQKESLLSQKVNFKTIEDAFMKCDLNNEKLITLADFQDGLKAHRQVQELCQIEPDSSLYDTAQTFFYEMDHRGEGSLTFSEFAYGVLGRRCGSQSLDKMLFDNASKNLIKQSCNTVSTLKDSTSVVMHSSSNVHHMSEFLYQQRLSQTANLSNLQKNLRTISSKINKVYEGLDLVEDEVKDTRAYSLMNLDNMREAKSIQELLQAMRVIMVEAKTAALSQADVAGRNQKDLYERFHTDANKDITTYLERLRSEGSHAANAASAAARAAAAIAAAASWPASNSAPRATGVGSLPASSQVTPIGGLNTPTGFAAGTLTGA